MRLALSLALLLAGAGTRTGCGGDGPVAPPYDPCSGKACGEACHLCAPGDPACAETQELKACTADGKCVSRGAGFTCPVPDPCAGKACGDACVISAPCRYSTPPCMVPDLLGRCDPGGRCVAGSPVTCPP